MFGKKKDTVREGGSTLKEAGSKPLPGQKELPRIVKKYLEVDKKIDLRLLENLLSVASPMGESRFDIRIFDNVEASARKITVQNYNSLDGHPGLIVFQGWFDEKSKQIELEEKRKLVMAEVKIFTEDEIRQQIESMTIPGSTVFFYVSGSPAYGGPLGRGAAVVELNSKYPGPKQKKYIMYAADVVDMEPIGKNEKWFDTDKAKDMAKFIKEHHRPAIY